MSSTTPLRERPQSNAGDPWRPQSITTPLRISKRDSPVPQRPLLARRTSSSYSSIKERKPVSKSPFLVKLTSQIPSPLARTSPSARKVSGEKRQRTLSMENVHPLGFKRRQSRGLQGLLQKEPVSKSPFKKAPPSDETDDEELPPPPPPKELFADPGRHSPSRASASPVRPSLVSKRLHGPRSQADRDISERRKTVTFDETCDVVEYDVEDEDSGVLPDNANAFDWVTDDDENDPDDVDDDDDARMNMNLNAHVNIMNTEDEEHEHLPHNDDNEHANEPDTTRGRSLSVRNPSTESSFDMVGEDSITGLVNSMLQDARPSTPPQQNNALPAEFAKDAEAGVPYGRTHHAERVALAHRSHHEQFHTEQETQAYPLRLDLPASPPHTPPRRSSTEATDNLSPGSHIPLGRSTHSERVKKAQRENEDVEADVKMLPPSPSPIKVRRDPSHANEGSGPVMENLVPRFEVATASRGVANSTPHPFESGFSRASPQTPSNTTRPEPRDPQDLSFSRLSLEPDASPFSHGAPITSTPPTSPPLRRTISNNAFILHEKPSRESLFTRTSFDGLPPPSLGRSPLGSRGPSPIPLPISSRETSPFPARVGSPFGRAASPSPAGSPGSSNGGRSPRISREDVHRRLLKKKSTDSPLRDLAAEDASSAKLAEHGLDESTNTVIVGDTDSPGPKTTRSALPTMTRHNPTYDGVMSIDPEPQAVDPPRPTVMSRAASYEDSATTATSAITSPITPALEVNFPAGSLIVDKTGSGMMGVQFGDMKSALDRLMADVAGEANLTPDGKGVVGLKVEAVTQGVKAGRFEPPEMESEEEEEEEMQVDELAEDDDHEHVVPGQELTATEDKPELKVDIPAMTVSTLLHTDFTSPLLSAASNPTPTIARAPSPLPGQKDAIRAREELIKAKKREARRREEEGEDDDSEDADAKFYAPASRKVGGRSSNRRSMSTGDAEDLLAVGGTSGRAAAAAKKRAEVLKKHMSDGGGLLDVLGIEDEEDPLADSIDRELRKLKGSAKANEYAKQIKELRAQENTGKGYGKVFVKVLGVKGLNVPIPQQSTAATCTLNNGIHFVTTPECRLGTECRINQEFELIEHSKLEFTLAIKIRRDPHIIAQYKINAPPPPPPAPQIAPPPASKGGMRSFFLGGGTPKRSSKITPPPVPPPQPILRLQENLARYLKPDGTLARAFISFKDIAKRCDTRLFETSYPLIGQKMEASGPPKTVQVGEIVLQMFRLPPLPGIPAEQLPQSLEECHRGLRHVSWHKVTYFEGTLTQNGGGCTVSFL
ncbi:hypothetical protein EW026_g4783 [Hermanssonia centrifuga]|uniref:Uncharacterized protein n=1 Tax=Hermanssonia centrifuga TaxID=98765 RepID=A0A4S4KGS3_9APHY|nr:hypothetical protein EW026_g4783 [Hermanssonia centrifuga]